jgi:hypothetical protein
LNVVKEMLRRLLHQNRPQPTSVPSTLNIKEEDFVRENKIDRAFRKKLLLTLLSHFGCRCVLCGDNKNGLDLDHAILPKSRGGNFVLRLITGQIVLNAIPLCQSCNRSKGAKQLELPTILLGEMKKFETKYKEVLEEVLLEGESTK